MNIAPISMSNMTMQKASFKGAEEKKTLLTDDMPDDAVVYYSNWGENYAFPITAGQIRKEQAEIKALKEQLAREAAAREANKESDEEYRARKISSTEWMM